MGTYDHNDHAHGFALYDPEQGGYRQPAPAYTDVELAQHLRDRAGKIAGRDPNTAAWLDLAAARIDGVRA